MRASSQSLFERGSADRHDIAFAHQWLDGELRVSFPSEVPSDSHELTLSHVFSDIFSY